MRMLGELLATNRDVCQNPEVLSAAAKKCENRNPTRPDTWGYKIESLLFLVDRPRHAIPEDLPAQLNLELSLEINGECNKDFHDILSHLTLDIEISAANSRGRCLCSWHLDKHICEEKDNAPKEIHPLYHFHHGGNRAKGLGDDTGRAVILDPPRVGHPPLDGIMAVDFVLANFVGSLWKKLKEDATYANLINKSQKELWKPYYESLNSAWGPTPLRKKARPELLMPTLSFR